jgi:hypothetical protein
MRNRDKIKTYIDYDKFLLAQGFSRKESKILSKAWYKLPGNDGLPDIAMLALKPTEKAFSSSKTDISGLVKTAEKVVSL